MPPTKKADVAGDPSANSAAVDLSDPSMLKEFLGGDDEEGRPLDPTLKALMEDTFGPSEGSATSKGAAAPPQSAEDKLAKGLEAVDALSAADGSVAIRWLHEGGECRAPPLGEPRLCFHCQKPSPAAGCGKCKVAGYCGRECQTADWGAKKGAFGGHKQHCQMYGALGKLQQLDEPAHRRATLEALLGRIRLYMCPFVLCKSGSAESAGATAKAKPKAAKGGGSAKAPQPPPPRRGFAFVQLGCTLAELALPCPRDCAGHRLPNGHRQILLHYVTLPEFESDVVESDPAAFGAARDALASAVASHDDKQELVVLLRTACGLVHVATHPLVPEWRVAVTMAGEYEAQEALQLDLDDA